MIDKNDPRTVEQSMKSTAWDNFEKLTYAYEYLKQYTEERVRQNQEKYDAYQNLTNLQSELASLTLKIESAQRTVDMMERKSRY